ncbi:hypothetical protein Tco_1539020 [Tanacetum coccineum]
MESFNNSIGERAQHKNALEKQVNEKTNQTTEEKTDTSNALDALDASSVIIESNGTKSKEQDTSSRSGNDAHVDDADIRPINNEEPMAEVQTTAEINIFATGQQHTEQPEFNNEGEVDQNAEQCHDICPLPAKLTDDKTTELSNQSLESENVCLKTTVAQCQKDFAKLEAHCIDLELQMQNNVLKSGQQSQFLKRKKGHGPETDLRIKSYGCFTENLEKAKKSAQLQKDKEVNGKPSMIDPARLPNTTNGCKPKPRNWQASMSSRVSNKDVHLGEHRKQKPFLKFNDLQCPTCKKCLYSANHDECVLEYLSRLNPRASAQNKDAKSHKTTKRYMPVEKSSASKKPERQIPTGHRFSIKNTSVVHKKTMTPRSCLRWKPTGRIFKTIGLRWVPKEDNWSSLGLRQLERYSPLAQIRYSLKYRYIVQSYKGRTQSLVAEKTDISENMASRNFDLMINTKTFDRNRSSLGLHGK